MPSTKTRAALGALALAIAATPVAGAIAAGSTPLASPGDVKVEKAYAYFDSFPPTHDKLAVFVVKTKGAMPRRYDGLIRAGGLVDGNVGGGSVGDRGSHCYTFSVRIRNGHFVTRSDGTGRKAATGSSHLVTVQADDADGHTVSSSMHVTLRAKRAGDRSGTPLGC